MDTGALRRCKYQLVEWQPNEWKVGQPLTWDILIGALLD